MNINRLLSLLEKGQNLNKIMETTKDFNVVTHEFGVLLNEELMKMLNSYVVERYYILFDKQHAYVTNLKNAVLQFSYMIDTNQEQEIYLDFNSIKKLNELSQDTYIAIKEDGEGFYLMKKEELYSLTEKLSNQSIETLSEALLLIEDKQRIENVGFLVQFIEEKLIERAISKTELAERTGIKYKTLMSKLKINSITGEELIRMGIVLDFDLNELKERFLVNEKVEPDDTIQHIASLIRKGYTNGITPDWELKIPDIELYPLNEQEREMVYSKLIDGFIAGYLKGDFPRIWQLEMNNFIHKEA